MAEETQQFGSDDGHDDMEGDMVGGMAGSGDDDEAARWDPGPSPNPNPDPNPHRSPLTFHP